MTSFRAPERSRFTLSLIAAAQADRTPTLRIRRYRELGEAITGLMHTVCQPFDTFSAAVDAAETVMATCRSVLMAIGVPDPFVPDDVLLQRALAFDGRLLAGVLKADGELSQAIITPDFFAALDPISPFGEIWALVRQRYAHRALDEIDLAVPRFGSDERALARLLLEMSETGVTPAPRRARWRARLPSTADRRAGLAHYFRHSAAFCLTHVRHELLWLADRAVAAGILTDRAAIWTMQASAVRALDHD